MDNHFDRRERTIYVWMLERNVTDDQLYDLFSMIGPIEKLIFKEYADGSPQHCLIVFRYVDSVLTAMSSLQGAELNGKPFSLRPLRESTHAVLMPSSTMYPNKSTSETISEHSDSEYLQKNTNTARQSMNNKWESSSSGSSCIWSPDSLDCDKLNLDDRRAGTIGSRSSMSNSFFSSTSGSPPNSVTSPTVSSSTRKPSAATIHASLRKPWRPSRGPIPAPLLTGIQRATVEGKPNQPPSLLSTIIPMSPAYGASPCSMSSTRSPAMAHLNSSMIYGSGAATASPRPLFPSLSSSSKTLFTQSTVNDMWRQSSPLSPPGTALTASDQTWFDYGSLSVPQAYRGGATRPPTPLFGMPLASPTLPPMTASFGNTQPPNSPPIGQCTRSSVFTFPDPLPSSPAGIQRKSAHQQRPPSSARLCSSTSGQPLPYPLCSRPIGGCHPKSGPRSAGVPPVSLGPSGGGSFHHTSSLFAWPEYHAFGGRF